MKSIRETLNLQIMLLGLRKTLPHLRVGRNPVSWSLEIEALDGGLIDSGGREAVTYEAPEIGYQANETVTMSTNDNTWYAAMHQTLFIKSRNGQVYSKLGIYFRINQNPDDPIYINFGGVANTNGSRNWEGDPNTMNPSGH